MSNNIDPSSLPISLQDEERKKKRILFTYPSFISFPFPFLIVAFAFGCEAIETVLET